MKRIALIILFLSVTSAYGQTYWPPFHYPGRWVKVRDVPSASITTRNWELSGGVSYQEISELDFYNMGEHHENYGYYEFYGDGEFDTTLGMMTYTLDWPPGVIDSTPPIYFPSRNSFRSPQGLESGFCNCDCQEAILDTIFPADGFGFCYDNPNEP